MNRAISSLALAATVALAAAGSAWAGDAKTIRIEPRPFYGATISLESGVRVFRPLPPTKHMIINPNRTPVKISLTEETRRIYKTVRHSGSGYASRGSYGSGAGGYIPYVKSFRRGRKRGTRGRRRLGRF